MFRIRNKCMLSITELEKRHFKLPKKLPPWASIVICHFSHKFTIWQNRTLRVPCRHYAGFSCVEQLQQKSCWCLYGFAGSLWALWQGPSHPEEGKNPSGHDYMMKHVIHRYSSYGAVVRYTHTGIILFGGSQGSVIHIRYFRVDVKVFPKQNTDMVDFKSWTNIEMERVIW